MDTAVKARSDTTRAGRPRGLCAGDGLHRLIVSYDKGEHPSPRRQSTEMALARARLRDWQVQLGRDQRG